MTRARTCSPPASSFNCRTAKIMSPSGPRRTPAKRRSRLTKAGETSTAGEQRHPLISRIPIPLYTARPNSGMSSILVQVICGGLLLGAVYALFSSGLTLVWGMMNIVNFAHGDFVMLGMYVAFVVWTLFGVGPLLGAPLAMLVLATLGIVVYFGLIRSVMKGPMLAQILGTFGLALLLRYSVFWWFGANFMTLPENIVGGTFDIMGIRIQASRLLAGVVALVVTLGLHLLLTRTSLGSKMLAVP